MSEQNIKKANLNRIRGANIEKVSPQNFPKPESELLAKAEEIAENEFHRKQYLRNNLARAIQGAERLGKCGWTLPYHFYLEDFIELEGSDDTQDEIEEFFLGYYTAREGQYLRVVLDDLLDRRPILSRWRNLLEQCAEAYLRRHFVITIPALLTILEGLLATHCKSLTKRITQISRLVRERQNSSNLDPVVELYWINIDAFLMTIFSNAHFADPRPPTLNRHWVLHGRDETTWKQIDSVRLFTAIQASAMAAECLS